MASYNRVKQNGQLVESDSRPDNFRGLDRRGCRFGLLVAVSPSHTEHSQWKWKFKCDCGNTTVSFVHSAKVTGHCGCKTQQRLHQRHLKHGQSGTALYKRWAAMKDRCGNPNNLHYDRYGGRGVRVCERWEDSFEAFCEDMGEPPSGAHTIERVDNDGDYAPGNCCWATRKVQQNNRHGNIIVTINGQTKTLMQWCNAVGKNYGTVQGRMKRGWDVEKALSVEVDPQHRNRRAKNVSII